MYGQSRDQSYALLDHYRDVSRHTVEIYRDPYIPPEERHGAKLTRIKQDIQRLLREGKEDYYFNVDCDIVNIPKDTITQLMSHGKDLIASMVWTEGRDQPTFFDTFEYRVSGCRFHPLFPPGIERTVPFLVDSVSTCYLAKAEVELAGEYSNPYPHIPFCADLKRKGFQIWVDPLSSVYHYDLERIGIGHQPLNHPYSYAPYIDDKGRQYQPQQVAAQLYQSMISNYDRHLLHEQPPLWKAKQAFLDKRGLITASIKVFNDADFIAYALASIYPYVDRIDIVEGAVKTRMHEAPDDGISRDGTIDAINNFVAEHDKEKKIRVLQGKWGSKEEIQAKLLEICKTKWMLYLDADETLSTDSMKRVREFCNANQHGEMVYARPERFLNFFHDFKHVTYSLNPLSPWSMFGTPHPFLIYRDIAGLNFGFHTVPQDGFGILINSDASEYAGKRSILDGVQVFHFGNAKNADSMRSKLTFERERGLGWECDEKGERKPVESNFWFSGNMPEDMVIEDFKGNFPEALVGHPRLAEERIKVISTKPAYTFEVIH